MLELIEAPQPTGRRVVIDLFFRTLAAHYGPRAVSVILSGTDSDGVIGIKHIKEQGGLTIAQDPGEADFDSMPRGAINTGMIDWILPVAQMPPQLVELMRNERRMHVPPENVPQDQAANAENGNSGGPLQIQETSAASDEAALVETLRFLRTQTGHDFTHYKRATILRRVARRLQVNLLEDIPSYLTFLRAHAAEVTALLHDLLISVTNFFRDRDAFATLESHIPQLFAGKKPGDQVRVWVCGCATGEEAYSVAILLSEHAARMDAPPSIQVFATDLDDDAIQAARTGLYPTTIEADVSQERLRRFFQQDQGKYRIRKEVRELVLFSVHNVLKDSPFSRLDLVTCRNLLIYLKREVQQGVFDIFHFAMKPGSLLFLGGSESMDDASMLFAPLDKRHRLYVRRTSPRPGWQLPSWSLSVPAYSALALPTLPRPPSPLNMALPAPLSSSSLEPRRAEWRTARFGDLHLALLEQYAPPSIILNANYDIVHLSEHAGQFLQIAGGEPSMNLLKVAHPELRLALRTALFRALSTEAIVTSRASLEIDGAPRLVNIHVRPARREGAQADLILIMFEAVPLPGTGGAGSAEIRGEMEAGDGANRPEPVSISSFDAVSVARELEAENQRLRDQVGATVEQYEASLEELKASNEELQAINEEMRSASEELETSKEEMQSINEELTTVNQELKNSVEELSRANSDLQNFMASTEIGTIFLNRQLHIQRFTPRIQELFNVIATDMGRPLSDITHKLNHHDLAADAAQVLRDLQPIEREVSSGRRWFLERLLPYQSTGERVDGVVLTFVEITERKQAEEALRQSEERLRLTIENVLGYAIFNLDAEGRVATWNEGGRRMTGYAPDDIIGQHFRVFYTLEDRQAQIPDKALETARATGRYEDEGWRVRKDGALFWDNEVITTMRDASGALTGFVKIARDLTEYKKAQEQRALLEREATLLSERNRMAQELHDTLSQGFTAIKMQMDAAEFTLQEQSKQNSEPGEAKQNTAEAGEAAGEATEDSAASNALQQNEAAGGTKAGRPQGAEPLLQHIVRTRAIAQQSLAEARSSIRALRAPLLVGGNLTSALEQLADQGGDEMRVRFFAEGTPFPMAAPLENDLYRIGQEALTNALRHSQAQHIIISLTYFADQIHLTIKDDGTGFDTQTIRQGFGVTGMQERAARIGAELNIASLPGQGTEISLTLNML